MIQSRGLLFLSTCMSQNCTAQLAGPLVQYDEPEVPHKYNLCEFEVQLKLASSLALSGKVF